MFLDSLVGDAAWRAKYALNMKGSPIPFGIIEEEIRATHPFQVFQLRYMLSVSYFEKALYELPEKEVTAETILKLADKIEHDIQGGLGARPLLSVPHLVSDEASCYYHGYTLAEMSVHQTRDFFKERDGYIVDNPKVGPTITKGYWESVDGKVKREKVEYDVSLAKDSDAASSSSVDLDMTVLFVDGDEVIADSSKVSGGILAACKLFEAYVGTRTASAQ
jgi:hypothetical protein